MVNLRMVRLLNVGGHTSTEVIFVTTEIRSDRLCKRNLCPPLMVLAFLYFLLDTIFCLRGLTPVLVVCAGCAPDFDTIKEVTLDRPFVYAIMNKQYGLPVFVGMVNQL